MRAPPPIRAVLFDKDGTLFSFRESWADWTADVIDELAAGDPVLAARLDGAIGFDRARGDFVPESPVIAGTADTAAALLAPHLPLDRAAVVHLLNTRATEAVMRPAVPLMPLLTRLRGAGLVLGVATNDTEAAARRHLHAAGVAEAFSLVLGYDSVPAPKPAPDMPRAFARGCGLAAEAVVMVGDSTHDLIAGRLAGMQTVAVLTGIATADDLGPLADTVLPDIGHLPGWLGLSGR